MKLSLNLYDSDYISFKWYEKKKMFWNQHSYNNTKKTFCDGANGVKK
jgi:hypothetical protein